jgi:hypothetical protein
MQSSIHTIGINTRFTSSKQRNAILKVANPNEERKIEMEQFTLKENTDKLSEFGGKRFLGLTPKGKEVFAKYKVNRDDLSLTVSFTHELSILLKEGALLANDCYSCGLNEYLNKASSFMVRKLKKPRSRKVTIQTLRWLKRLQLLTEIQYHEAFDKDKVTYSFLREIGSQIHTGFGISNIKPNLTSIGNVWKFPKNRTYFNPEETWKYPDEL